MRSLGNGIRNFYGQLTINAASGEASGGLIVNAIAALNVPAVTINGSNTAGQSNGLFVLAGANSADRSLDVLNSAGSSRLFGIFGDGHFALGYNGTANVITGTAAGNITINAPSSGTALVTTAGTGGYAIQGTGATGAITALFTGASGDAGRLAVQDGQSGNRAWEMRSGGVSVGVFDIYDLTAATSRLQIDTSGNVSVPNGTGSLSPVYAGIPVNTQAGSYTTVLSDANKCIKFTGASAGTLTIAANSSVAYPVGTAITFVNRTTNTLTISINSDSLVYSNTGAVGSRTLGTNAMATAIKTDATIWLISGAGIS
jgi:hypothetical protein